MRRVAVILLLVCLCLPLAAEEAGQGQTFSETNDSKKTAGIMKSNEVPLPGDRPTVNKFKVRFRLGWSRSFLTDMPSGMNIWGWEMGASVNIPLSHSFAIETGLISEINLASRDGYDELPTWYQFKLPLLGKFYYVNSGSFGATAKLGLMYTFRPFNIVDASGFEISGEDYISLVIGAGADFGTVALDLRLVIGLQDFLPNNKRTAVEFGVTF